MKGLTLETVTLGALARVLDEHPAAPDAPVLHTADRAVTLAEFRRAAAALATQLVEAGLKPGEPVACIVVDGISTLVAAFGTWQAAGVFVPLNPRLSDKELAAALASTQPGAVIAAATPGPVPVTLFVPDATSLAFTAHGRRTATDVPVHDADAALVMRTSGTTGPPKAVVLRHDGVLGGMDTVAGQLRGRSAASGRPPMPNLIPTTLALWAGLWNAIFGLRAGAPVVLLDQFTPTGYAELVRRFEIRSTVLAPAMMTMLANDPAVTDLSPLRSVRSITAPLTPHQARAFHAKFGVSVANCYGQTELGGEVVGWTNADLRDFGEAKLGAVGRVHPGVELKVFSPDHDELPVDEVGEIWISSPFLSEVDEAMRSRMRDGFLQTGDLGRVDPDGFVWLDGRIADLVNRGGLKVVPQEVEEVLRAQPGVADACVAGVPDDRLGEVPVAWVVPLDGGSPPAAADLLAAVRSELAAYKVPVGVVFLDELPRSEIGKVLRTQLTARYGEA